ncbi:MAG: ImmA/IrrE family metallo-endopeptidase [Planctomycetia bacterium]|nr:ImmA/IrrE family metallo-endopeptidase [Planctomycetia bacterium]
MAKPSPFWTHPSVLKLPKAQDPVAYITQSARALVFGAIETGWTGPPFDPFALADHLELPVVPREDILDARTVPLAADRLQIEYNPNRPGARVRFSIAHEIAHTLFPDCRDRIRNRVAREHMHEGDWQLELLCNVAAAEILMPIGSFPDLKSQALSIDVLMELRKQYEVSTEALLLRVVRLTDSACTAFCTSRQEQGEAVGRYRIDYAVGSRSWSYQLPSGTLLPEATVVRECTAIGFTAKGTERWPEVPQAVRAEVVGIPPFPKHRYPRVVGIAYVPDAKSPARPTMTYLRGDATQPRGPDLRIVCHVVNDRAARWGGGFALVMRRRFPDVQQDFVSWAEAHRDQFALGQGRYCPVDETLAVFSMICQQGYGPSRRPRVRYGAMKTCLEQLAEIAVRQRASVHMPRIGCGQAGGSWAVVSELIDETLCARDVPVTVYDLPGAAARSSSTPGLLFES